MISNDYDSSADTDGDFFHHSTNSKGSLYTVTVGSRRLPLYPLVIGCLGLLNIILLLAAVAIGIYCGQASGVSDPYQRIIQTLSIEVKSLHTERYEAIKEHQDSLKALQREQMIIQKLKLQLKHNTSLSDNLLRKLQGLQLEKATLESNTSQIRHSCGRCQTGWFLLNTTCYFHSKSSSLPKKSWLDSKKDCRTRGGNLTVIDNLEKQLDIFEYLPKLELNVHPWWKGEGTWIGLTDAHTENNWVWINNVTLEHGYWIAGEPNNYGPSTGEDCVAYLNMKHPRQTWFDASCNDEMYWLCEKKPQL